MAWTVNKKHMVCDSSPAVDDRQDVRTVVSWGQDDAGVWRLEVPLSVIVVETVQAVDTVGNVRDAVALKQQLWHHLPTVQRVTRRLRQHNGVCHTALQKQREGNADWLINWLITLFILIHNHHLSVVIKVDSVTFVAPLHTADTLHWWYQETNHVY